jgi:hypothetical protein
LQRSILSCVVATDVLHYVSTLFPLFEQLAALFDHIIDPSNLFSLTKAMQQGWILGGDNTNGITLKKGKDVLKLDIPIVTPKGVVYATYMRRIEVTPLSVSTTMKIETSIGGRNQKNSKVLGMEYYEWCCAAVLSLYNRQGQTKEYSQVQQP